MKWDKRAFVALIILIITVGSYNLYLYELFFGNWDKIPAKALFYLTTGIVCIYLAADEIIGYSSLDHFRINLICKLAIATNFLLFAFILYGLSTHPILSLFLLNGSIFALSVIVLISGIKYDYFKNI